MDIQHISALIETIGSLGFSVSTGRKLLFNACLPQENFVIGESMCFGTDTIHYDLYFKKDAFSKSIICSYYEATLKKAVTISAAVVNDIDVLDLESRMDAVNWHVPPDSSASEKLNIGDKNTWKQEVIIEEIVKDLEILAYSEEGAVLANILKYKFWAESELQRLIPALTILKGRYELSQRFYVINGDGITAKEAYRFLNNRWMERQIHANNRLLRQSEAEQREAIAVTKSTGNKRKTRQSKENSGT